MFVRIELLGHYFELGSQQPEQTQQVVVVDPGGQLIPVDSNTSSPYVGFYNPGAAEEEEEVEDAKKRTQTARK